MPHFQFFIYSLFCNHAVQHCNDWRRACGQYVGVSSLLSLVLFSWIHVFKFSSVPHSATLGDRFLEKGHTVMFVLKQAAKISARLKHLMEKYPGSLKVMTLTSALADATIAVLAVPYSQVGNVVEQGGDQWMGKIVIDVTNNLDDKMKIAPSDPNQTPCSIVEIFCTCLHLSHACHCWYFIGFSVHLLSERRAFVIKSFNSTGFENMAQPILRDEHGSARCTNFVAGSDRNAKRTVMGLSDELGFDTVDLGGISVQAIG
jgi:predicted dinucleotide-binding enzyme